MLIVIDQASIVTFNIQFSRTFKTVVFKKMLELVSI
jgi:hypothetical protein